MATREQKQQMLDFVIDRAEDTSRYVVQEADLEHLLIKQNPELFENPILIDVLLHTGKMTKSKLNETVAYNTQKGIYTCNLFYKDGENFHVRLGKRGHTKGDDRSLKNYCQEEINSMIHLRGLEKEILDRQCGDMQFGDSLCYYQPETQMLSQAIRVYRMRPVELDYSHVDRSHSSYGFVRPNAESKDYKIADETHNIKDGPVRFRGLNRRCLVMLPYIEQQK